MNDQRPSVGIMLVHGIGDQAKGTHLRTAADALLEHWQILREHDLQEWVDSGGVADLLKVEVQRASVTHTPSYLEVAGVPGVERVLFAEAWWAKSFPAPSYREMMLWSLTALFEAFTTHLTTRWEDSDRWIVWRVLGFGALALVGLVMIPLLTLLLASVSLLAAIPIKALRTWLMRIQRGISESIGDAYVFASNRLSRGSIDHVLESRPNEDDFEERGCCFLGVIFECNF